VFLYSFLLSHKNIKTNVAPLSSIRFCSIFIPKTSHLEYMDKDFSLLFSSKLSSRSFLVCHELLPCIFCTKYLNHHERCWVSHRSGETLTFAEMVGLTVRERLRPNECDPCCCLPLFTNRRTSLRASTIRYSQQATSIKIVYF
jgi:hypothetical protein